MINTTSSVLIPVTETSQIGEARRTAAALANTLGLDERRRGEVGIVVTEAAGNLVQHTQGGEIVLRCVARGGVPGLEILALDRGPGMADIGLGMADGYSTAGTPGTGLGAIARLSAQFDIHSMPEIGTALWARIWAGASPDDERTGSGFEIGAVCLPVSGEQECGDAWAVQDVPGHLRMIVADGLGHGPHAAEASGAAVTLFHQSPDQTMEALISLMHQGLRHTRGAAVGLIELGSEEARYVGVGNIAGAIVASDATRSMVSHHGTVGLQLRQVRAFVYPWSPDALIVLHSDGLNTQWHLDRYSGLIGRHPSLIAGVLYRDFCRGRDDVTVLVIRREGHKA